MKLITYVSADIVVFVKVKKEEVTRFELSCPFLSTLTISFSPPDESNMVCGNVVHHSSLFLFTI